MAVDLTQFRPDEGVGSIIQHIDGQSDVISMEEMKYAIRGSSESNHRIIFRSKKCALEESFRTFSASKRH